MSDIKLKGTLPKGDANGAGVIAADLIADPRTGEKRTGTDDEE